MKILQAGMEKSGNYWLYRIIQSVIQRAGLPNTTYIQTQPIHALAKTWQLSFKEQADLDVLDIEPDACFYRISSVFRMSIPDLSAYLQHANHVWTHSEYNPRCETVLPQFDRTVYIIRDPRDVALSVVRFHFTPYMQTYYPISYRDADTLLEDRLHKYVNRWRHHVAGYLLHARRHQIHIVFYERLLHDFDRELSALLAYFGLEATPQRLAQVRHDVDFSHMQRENPGHVRKGRSMQWVEKLTPAQKARALHHAGALLPLLGYPTADAADGSVLPSLPADLSPDAIQRAATLPPTPRERLKRAIKTVIRL